jgi:PEP-CTERM motif
MRISGLLVAVIALLMLTRIATAYADIAPWQLMETDLFDWQGQDGTMDWHEILQFYDCTTQLEYYLTHVPEAPVIVQLPPIDPPLIDPPPIDPPTPAIPTAVPEPSTWALLLLGFAGLGYAGFRRGREPMSSHLLTGRPSITQEGGFGTARI